MANVGQVLEEVGISSGDEVLFGDDSPTGQELDDYEVQSSNDQPEYGFSLLEMWKWNSPDNVDKGDV